MPRPVTLPTYVAEPITLPIADYAPDRAAWSGGSSNIRNVYRRTADTYGAVASPSVYSNALTARCQGAAAFIDSSGTVSLLAGDINDLYLLRSGSTTWSNVSKSLHAYSCGSDTMWQYAYFNGTVIATDFTDVPQAFTLASSAAFADLAGTPPNGRYIGVVKNSFVVLANLFSSTNLPQSLQWCAAGNHTSWPTPGTTAAATVQAGRADLLGGNGWIKGIAASLANADALIFQQYGVRRMMYVGPPAVFAFLPMESGRGTDAPHSIVTYGGYAYYLAQDGFYANDGATSTPIGAEWVDKTVLNQIDQSALHRVVGTADPINKLIWWCVPFSGNGGTPNVLLSYNWQLGKWSICDVTCETITRLLSIGYTLDQLYTILGYTLDTLPAPLDSPLWSGGRLMFGTFDTNHKLNFMSGAPLAATVESAESEPVPGKRFFVRSTRPQVDGVGTVPSVKIGHRERYQDAVAYGPSVALNSLGFCPQRTSGRFIRAQVTIPSSTTWTNIGGTVLQGTTQGSR